MQCHSLGREVSTSSAHTVKHTHTNEGQDWTKEVQGASKNMSNSRLSPRLSRSTDLVTYSKCLGANHNKTAAAQYGGVFLVFM